MTPNTSTAVAVTVTQGITSCTDPNGTQCWGVASPGLQNLEVYNDYNGTNAAYTTYGNACAWVDGTGGASKG